MTLLSNKINLICFSFLIIIALQINLFPQSIPFNRLTTDDGLSNNYVYDLIQDKSGFLWFATDDGLNRYDGYEFKVYRNDPENKNSISDNSIWVIEEDRSGKIWMGTKNGFVNCYDPVLDRFTNWEIKSDITKENPITAIFIDSKDSIWIGTYRSGIYKLNPKTGTTTNWLHNANDSSSISNNFVSSIIEDNAGNIWISTYNGLNKLKPNETSGKFTHYYKNNRTTNSLSDNLIWAITKSGLDENKLWIGTANGSTILDTETQTFRQIEISNPDKLQFGTSTAYVVEELIGNDTIIWMNSYSGLIRYNISKNIFSRFVHNENNLKSLVGDQINNFIKDRSGVLWIATHNGLSYLSQKNLKFNSISSFESNNIDASALSKLDTKAIVQTENGTLWIGTDDGLFATRNSGNISSSTKYNKFFSENIWCLTADNQNNLWIGTYGSGLYQLNYKTNKLLKIDLLGDMIKSSSKYFVKSVLTANKNNLWVGYWGVGLARINQVSKKVNYWNHVKSDKGSLSHDDVWVLYQDSKSRVWVGTNGGGLNLFDGSNDGKFYHINYDQNNPGGLSSNSIYSITESRLTTNENNYTILWVGTNNGLNKLTIDNTKKLLSKEIKNIRITHYNINNGLADNSIKSIVEDKQGNLWLGTSSGISFFDLQKNTFTNYSSADGVVGNDFNFSSSLSTDDNLIFMGSTSGLNFFDPAEIVQSNFKPDVVITDFQIFNNSVPIKPTSVLQKSIFNTKEITISHTQNVFSFQFSALDFNSPSSVKYAYQMEGFDKEWIQVGNRRFVTYTNLNPGKYKFNVKSTNSDGVWNNNPTSVAVIITPPWWQTPWAILLYFVVFVLGLWAIIKFQSNRTKLQHELKIREFESYHLREIEKMKSRFFANLSHEFRTPLMLIKSPIQELISGRIKDNLSDYYKLLLRNTEKLQQLIDQLLELSQLESASIPLKAEPQDLVSLLKSFTASFIPLAEMNSIKFNFNSEVEAAVALIDKDKLEKIINNLLSNAFKFTPIGGVISVELSIKNKSDLSVAKISVSDSGIGIPKELQSKIFDRFFQVDDPSNRSAGGSGIGLALVKELVSLHNWQISVSSAKDEGTEFLIEIPLTSNYKTEIFEKQDVDKIESNTSDTERLSYDSPIAGAYTKNDEAKSLILFVEDTIEVRNYVYDILKSHYIVLLAENAETGLELAQNNLPDLIISDVMMPGMDGFEFCSKIKTDWKTSHIPIILLTAKATQQNKIEGLETGADDYLTKPFDFNELFVRIKNLITQRKQLRDKFGKEIIIRPESLSENSLDKEFIKKIIDVIEKNLHNENFNSELLAKELFVSRSQLTRKLNAITNQGPGEFIRIYKLKRAAQMIIENKLSITQIAYEVGFGSPAQFTRAFQKYFNCLPSDFNDTAKK